MQLSRTNDNDANTPDLGSESFVLGGNVFGWSATEEQSIAVLDGFAEAGGRAIDTADVYSAWVAGNKGGESESIIGRWMAARKNRDRLIISTKVGQLQAAPGLSRASIRTGLEASLRRLRTDYIDVFYAHFDDPETPLEETMWAFDEVVREGKVRFLAASNYSPKRLREALDISRANGSTGFSAFQVHYNLVFREDFEQKFRPLLAERSVLALPYYSLAQGFLTGKYRASGNAGSVRAKEATRHLGKGGLRVLAELDRLAEAHGVPQAAVALSWLKAQPGVGAPLASARTTRQLTDLLATHRLQLSVDDLTALDVASSN
jgi:aryl-alcohol dehydrogenase-like predicted oxidoreductase